MYYNPMPDSEYKEYRYIKAYARISMQFLSNVAQWWQYLISETSAQKKTPDKKSILGSENRFSFKPINSPGDHWRKE